MVGQSRKWMVLVATTWVQAFTGTNFDFSSYSSELKSAMGISQLQLNYLSVASDLGKAFGWCCGVSLFYIPLPAVLFVAAVIGGLGYGVQWLLIHGTVSLPYFAVFLLCLLAGSSICWFNTISYVLCIKNFPSNRALAISLTISFNGLSAALFNLIANSINPKDDTLYLLLNAVVPLVASLIALPPILRQPPPLTLPAHAVRCDSLVFAVLNVVAVLTGVYLLGLHTLSSTVSSARALLAGAILLLVSPLFIPGIVYARHWVRRMMDSSIVQFTDKTYNLADVDELELHRELIASENESSGGAKGAENGRAAYGGEEDGEEEGDLSCCDAVLEKGRLTVLGEEHESRAVVRRCDFWLYYAAYFCGGTIGLVYSNNLGQISQSLGFGAQKSSMVTIYSACSFFGRLLSAAPDFLRDKAYFARTGWLVVALVPNPIAFLLLSVSSSGTALQIGTALIGFSSGFMFAASVSITSELFGPNSASVNHNILITNIPIGSVLYGLMAALVYDSNVGGPGKKMVMVGDTMVCMGRSCYWPTFVSWGCLSLLGLLSSLLLFLRTRPAYDRFERNRVQRQSY